MSHTTGRLADRLRQGLATAVLSAAALAVPAAEATGERQGQLAQNSGGTVKPAARSKTAPATKPPAAAAGSKSSAPAAKPAPSGGCGAHEGGCGPSR